MRTYRLTDTEHAIECLLCHHVSPHTDDIRQKRCPACHANHDAAALLLDIMATEFRRSMEQQLWTA